MTEPTTEPPEPTVSAPRPPSAWASVIIPAHNEAASIDVCLDAVLADPRVGDLDVVVVANGCKDDTAARAQRRGAPVRVIDTPVGSKAGALELGRTHTNPGPRVYLDGDIEISPGAISAAVELLERPGIHGSAPSIRLTPPPGASWWLQRYTDVWRQAPYFERNLIGSGFFALSQEASDRIGPWPSIIADDLVALCHLDERERATARDHWFVHELPRRLRDVVTMEVRREAGREEFEQWAADAGRDIAEESPGGRWLLDVARDPRQWPGIAAFVGAKFMAKRKASAALRAGQVGWNQVRN